MAKPCDCTADMATMQDGMCKIDQAAFIDAGAAVIDAGAIFIGARAVFTGARAAFNGARAAFIEARALLDMIEPTTDPQGTFANGGVLKASPKVPHTKHLTRPWRHSGQNQAAWDAGVMTACGAIPRQAG